MKLGVHVPNFASLASPADLADLAARAEAAGWDGFFIWDHVARPEGTFPMAEPWVALTAVAMATQRLRIGPMVTPLARRRPWNVARQVASLDQLTGGRVTLGVGPGRQQRAGVPRRSAARRATRGCGATCSMRAFSSCAPPGRVRRSGTRAPTTRWTT